MVKYECNNCLKEFKQKSHYDKHMNRKTTCPNNKKKLETMIEERVSEMSIEDIHNIKNDTKLRKKNLGQFYTTNYEYILQNMSIPDNVNIIVEPFAGQCDLLNFIKKDEKSRYKFELYDIEPKKENVIKRDTLNNPIELKKKFVLTNPPYLARNKSADKSLFDKYNVNDLYKCFIKHLINELSMGGILITPLNFWCSIRKADIQLRKEFLMIYDIINLNIFEEQVFDDTSYTTCCFNFILKNNQNLQNSNINCYIYPSLNNLKFNLNNKNLWTIGGEIYKLKLNKKIKIERATSKNKNSKNLTKILLKCIDDNINNQLGLSIIDNDNYYIDETEKLSCRSYASLIIEPELSIEKQKKLVEKFNKYIKEQREKYNSLFLTNYRESNSICRKRISFKLAFDIINYLLT
jgi:hypothetical protein